ncbi:hypothetical protein FJT64_000204 [Amphibalanus amphitrite]|uniref:Uncharacterized protein n=1 Tax=Amphibalanus amphitrite TaxID=1232801 RepID=A0A6A4XB68_AMPAM|nr:hypothetical protein FJT64_000204 [Amphibalanus amphitrite]
MAAPRRIQFEEILRLAGDGGLWQVLVFVWSVIGGLMTGAHNVSSAFVGGEPEHRCALPGELANETCQRGAAAPLAAVQQRHRPTGLL